MLNSVGWFEGCAFVAIDFGVEDVIMKEKANQINEILENLHAGEDCDQEIPIDPVVCLFLVAECEDSADVMFFAIVDEVLDEAGYVAGAFVRLESGLDRVD